VGSKPAPADVQAGQVAQTAQRQAQHSAQPPLVAATTVVLHCHISNLRTTILCYNVYKI